MIGSKYAMNILFGMLLFCLPFDFIVNAVLQGILSLNLSDPKKYDYFKNIIFNHSYQQCLLWNSVRT